MEYAPTPSDLARVELGPDDPTPPAGTRIAPSSSTPANGVRPSTSSTPRPETIRLRGRLDDVMARLHAKLDGINGDSAQAIAKQLNPKATRMARQAFSPADLDLEDDDDPTD